jgi:hypothetical protein
MFLWIVTGLLFTVWLVAVLLGKGGFIHILILCAIATGILSWSADAMARRRS